MIQYLFIAVFAVAYALIRGKHDSYIRESMGGWKPWAIVEAIFFGLYVTIPAVIVSGFPWWTIPILFFIYAVWFSLVFDCWVGYLFGGSIWYLGEGKWDSMIRRAFQYTYKRKGRWYVYFKVWWLIIATGIYFEIIKEFNL